MLESVKVALRVTTNEPGIIAEIQDLIDSALLDLSMAGITVLSSDALIKRAIITYCKANYGYDNKEADRFQKSYEMLKQHLSLAGDYRAVE